MSPPAGGRSAALTASVTPSPGARPSRDHGMPARKGPLRQGGGHSAAEPSSSDRALRPKPMADGRPQPRPVLAWSSLGNVTAPTTTCPPAPPDPRVAALLRHHRVAATAAACAQRALSGFRGGWPPPLRLPRLASTVGVPRLAAPRRPRPLCTLLPCPIEVIQRVSRPYRYLQ